MHIAAAAVAATIRVGDAAKRFVRFISTPSAFPMYQLGRLRRGVLLISHTSSRRNRKNGEGRWRDDDEDGCALL